MYAKRLLAVCLAGLLAVFLAATLASASSLVGDGPGEYVILGDSYASGEGVNPIGSGGYFEGTDEPGRNMCHRSSLAYGPRLAAALEASFAIEPSHWLMPACAGDETSNLATGSGADHSSSPVPQLDYLSGETRFGTLTIGGNDVGFADIIAACLENLSPRRPTFLGGSPQACDERIDEADRLISDGTMKSRLLGLYRTIIQRAPHGRLVVTTYPRLFPDDADYAGLWKDGEKYCPVTGHVALQRLGFASTAVDRFNQTEAALNGLIASTVELIRHSDGLPGRISLARLDTGDLAQHPYWCSESDKPEPYITGGLFTTDGGSAVGPGPKRWASRASFHPTEAGHAAFASTIAPSLAPAEPLKTLLTSGGETLDSRGPISVQVGATDQEFTITALNGTPDWDALDDPYAGPRYEIGFEEVPDKGLEVTSIVPSAGNAKVVRFNAPSPGIYTFRALVTDHNGDTAVREVDVDVGPDEPIAPAGRFAFPGSSRPVALSGNGRWLAYVSVLQISGIQYVNVWLRNTVTEEPPILVSHSAGNSVTAGVEEYDAPGISDDGRWVTFASYNRLAPGDTNNARDVYLYDHQADSVTLVPGTTGWRASPPSNDGRYVVAFDPAGALWRIDLASGERLRIDASAAGVAADRAPILEGVSLSDDGRTVLFSSRATNLAPGDTDALPDLFLKDLATDAIMPVTAGLSDSGERLISAAGGTIDNDQRLVAFAASGIADGQWRQMLLDRYTGEHVVVAPGSNRIQLSADGGTVAYTRFHLLLPESILDRTNYEAQHRGTVSTSPLSVQETGNFSLNYDGTEPRVYGTTPTAQTRSISDDGRAILWYSNYGYQIPGVYPGGGYFLQRLMN